MTTNGLTWRPDDPHQPVHDGGARMARGWDRTIRPLCTMILASSQAIRHCDKCDKSFKVADNSWSARQVFESEVPMEPSLICQSFPCQARQARKSTPGETAPGCTLVEGAVTTGNYSRGSDQCQEIEHLQRNLSGILRSPKCAPLRGIGVPVIMRWNAAE
jgi:hypothetical protein